MMYVALLALVALIVSAISFAGVLRWHIRQSARREDLLVSQLCHLAGKPWQQAPIDEWEEPEPERQLVTSPEQLPDY